MPVLVPDGAALCHVIGKGAGFSASAGAVGALWGAVPEVGLSKSLELQSQDSEGHV